MTKNFKTRTCNRCGWVYMGVSRAFAETEVAEFNDYFKTLSKKKRKHYYNDTPSSIKNYEHCQCGNLYTNFRDAESGDAPWGVTMSPIIYDPPVKTIIKKTIKKINKNFKNTLSKLAK